METLMLLLILGTTAFSPSIGTVDSYSFDESFEPYYEEGMSFHQSHGDYIWSASLLNFTPPEEWIVEDLSEELKVCPPVFKPEISKEEQCIYIRYFEGNSEELFTQQVEKLQTANPVRLAVKDIDAYTARVSWDVYGGAHLPEHYEARRFYLKSIDLFEFKVGSYVDEDLVLDILQSISFG